VVQVPVGTVVLDHEGETVADLNTDGQEAVIAMGGKGGFGNAHFASSTRQAPRVAEKGEPGEELNLVLELKMIADVGLVGLPNAGKSTFLASVSNARPEIADYPFTTLTPNLGVVDIGKEASLLLADIPGLIEGASQGKGLGDEFLRHVERTLVLIHLIDIYQEDVSRAYEVIQKELKSYKVDLSDRAQIIALNKIEGLDKEIVADKLAELKKAVPKSVLLMAISAHSKQGVLQLLFAAKDILDRERAKLAETEGVSEGLPIIRLTDSGSWHIEKTGEGFVVTGQKIQRFARRTRFGDYHGEQRLRDIMRKMGIMQGLIKQGIATGDKITIGKEGSIEY
jgi:GTP-binding protein